MAFELTERLHSHLLTDEVVWLTTVSRTGRPSPRPVWFLWDGAAVLVYSPPTAYKVAHIAANDHVTAHFNSDFLGNDVAVVHARAAVDEELPPPSKLPGYLDKYASGIARIGMTVASFDERYSTPIRITPYRSWSFV